MDDVARDPDDRRRRRGRGPRRSRRTASPRAREASALRRWASRGSGRCSASQRRQDVVIRPEARWVAGTDQVDAHEPHLGGRPPLGNVLRHEMAHCQCRFLAGYVRWMSCSPGPVASRSRRNHGPTLGAPLYNDFEVLDLFGPLEMFATCPIGSRWSPAEAGTGAQRTGAARACRPRPRLPPPLDFLLIPAASAPGPGRERAADRMAAGSCREVEVAMTSAPAPRSCPAGLLDGRRATTNKMFFSWPETWPAVRWVREARWVEDGTFWTSSGVSAGSTWRSPSLPGSPTSRPPTSSRPQPSTSGTATLAGPVRSVHGLI